jgi:hypothetical protein
LNNLKLLLIILVWENFKGDIINQNLILNVFWQSYKSQKDSMNYSLVPIFEDTITNYEYMINYSIWIEKISKFGVIEENKKASRFYFQLLEKSLANVLSDKIKQIEYNEMITYAYNWFPINNNYLQRSHFHSIMILSSVYFYQLFLTKINQFFYSSNISIINETFITNEEKKLFTSLIDSIVLFPYRLNLLGNIFNLIFLKFKEFMSNDNYNNINDNESVLLPIENELFNDDKISYINRYYLFQKKVFKSICLFILDLLKPFKKFEFSNLIDMLSKEYLCLELVELIKISMKDSKETLLKDLPEIDIDFTNNFVKIENLRKSELKFSKNSNEKFDKSDSKFDQLIDTYKFYLKLKTNELIQNVNEIIFRFNIMNNPWMEIINEENENISFIDTLLQNSNYYLQISKKFHMWKTTQNIITFFKLNKGGGKIYKENYNENENENNENEKQEKQETNTTLFIQNTNQNSISEKEKISLNILKFFANIKTNMQEPEFLLMPDEEIQKYIISLENNSELRNFIESKVKIQLITELKDKMKINSENNLESKNYQINFEYFKFFFDICLADNINSNLSKKLFYKAKEYLKNCKLEQKLYDNINEVLIRFETIIQSNNDNEDCLSKLIASIKNLESVQLKEPSSYKEQVTRQNSLISLLEKVNDKKSDHKELAISFDEALKSLELNEKESPNLVKNNYLKRFLEYIIQVGNIYYDAKLKNTSNIKTNYIKVLQKYPKEIIANLLLKYKSEEEALKICKLTKTNIINVILEFTSYYKKEIIYLNEFNNYFQKLIEENDYSKSKKITQGMSQINNEDLLKINNPIKLMHKGIYKESQFEINKIKENSEKIRVIEKDYDITMRILEFIYTLYNKNNKNLVGIRKHYAVNNSQFNNSNLNLSFVSNNDKYLDKDSLIFNDYFYPFYISFYRFDYAILDENGQVKFWKLLIEKYHDNKLIKNYILIVFTKFYFLKCFYNKGKDYQLLFDYLLNNENHKIINNHKNCSNNIKQIDEKSIDKIDKIEKDNLLNKIDCSKSSFTYLENKKEAILKKLYQQTSNKPSFDKLIPPEKRNINNANFMSDKISAYLDKKLKNTNKFNGKELYIKFDNSIVNKNDFDDLNKKYDFQSLTSISHEHNLTYYESLCQNLIKTDQLNLALKIAEKYIEINNSEVFQNLLLEMIKTTKDEDLIVKFLVRLNNKVRVFDIFKDNYLTWNPENGIHILNFLLDSSNNEIGLNYNLLVEMKNKLTIFKNLSKRNLLNGVSLKNLDERCINNFESIINEMINNNCHDLCYQLIRVYKKNSKYSLTVKFSEVILLLSSDDMNHKIKALEIINKLFEDKIEVNKINFCIDIIEAVSNYQNKLLIINYLLINNKEDLSTLQISNLNKKQVSIKVFYMLPEKLRSKLIVMIDNSKLILETLLINKYFDIYNKIINQFQELLDENIISYYCFKSMNLDNILRDNPTTYNNNLCTLLGINSEKTINLLNNKEDEKYNNDLIMFKNNDKFSIDRENIQFENSPDFELFKNLIRQCKNKSIVSEICFEVVKNSSKYLLKDISPNIKLFLIHLIDKVLDYLYERLKILKKQDSYDEELTNNKIIFMKKINNFFKIVLLHNIGDIIKYDYEQYYYEISFQQNLRDVLIENDYLDLAEKLCEELKIDCSKVDLELGLFALKNRDFNKAKKYFKKLVSNQNNIFDENSNSKNNLEFMQNSPITEKLILTLQGPFNLTINEMNFIYMYLHYIIGGYNIDNSLQNNTLMSKNSKHINNNIITIDNNKYFDDNEEFKLNSFLDVFNFDKYLVQQKTIIVKETLYYIKKYGRDDQMLKFYVTNGMAEETIDFILKKNISLKTFKSQILLKSKGEIIYTITKELKNKLNSTELKESSDGKYLKSQSIFLNRQSDYINDLLNEIVIWFIETNATDELIKWFILMEDYLQACIHSLHTAFTTDNLNVKIKYLDKGYNVLQTFLNVKENEVLQSHFFILSDTSKKYLNYNLFYIQNYCLEYSSSIYSSISHSQDNNDDEKNQLNLVLLIKTDKESLKIMSRSIKLQIKILNVIPEINPWLLLTKNISDKQKILEKLIIYNNQLAFEIIEEFSFIDVFQIFMDCTRYFINSKMKNCFEQLLIILSKWNDENKLKKVNLNFNETWNEIIKYAISISLGVGDLEYINNELLPLLTNINDRITILISLNNLEEACDYAEHLNNNIQILLEIRGYALNSNNISLVERIDTIING